MKKLTQDEYQKTRRTTEGNWSPVTLEIINLQIGEHLLLEKSDWHRKQAPFALVKQIQNKYNTQHTVETLVDRSGWIITRIK